MTTTPATPVEGPIITGTLRPEDLIPALTAAYFDRETDQTLAARRTATLVANVMSDDPDGHAEAINDLHDWIEGTLPEGWTFGGHEGDPACIGFWRWDEDGPDGP